MPRLQVLNGKRQGAIFDLHPSTEHVIGHRATASIPIDDPWVSWDHARLFFEDGRCSIEDLGSTNGTYVNCVRVKRESLNHQDIVFLGKTHVIFLAPANEPVTEGSGSGSHLLEGAPFVLGKSSEMGPFNSGSGPTPIVPPARDPFASASASGQRRGASGSRVRDPFSESGVDPFSSGVDPFSRDSGPDFGAPLQAPSQPSTWSQAEPPRDPTVHLRGAPAPYDFLNDPNHDPFGMPSAPPGVNPFAVEDPVESSVIRRNVGGGFLPNDLGAAQAAPPPPPPPPPPPSARAPLFPVPDPSDSRRSNPFAETRGDEEVSPLAASSKPSRSLSLSGIQDEADYDVPDPSAKDIEDLLGRPDQLAALDDPAFGLSGDGLPSEMRTRMLNTDRVNELIAEHDEPEPDWAADEWEPGELAPQQPRGQQTGTESTHADLLAQHAEPGQAAFEIARLHAEVNRLRSALQAVQQGNPRAVQAAAEVLRDAELGRLSERVAELERDVALARQDVSAREQELNFVTEEMIEKEDLIDQLRRQLSSGRAPARTYGEEDLSSLEF